jgi:heat shock protein HtpX
MRRHWYGGDAELSTRMFVTMFLLAAVYLGFIAVLFYVGTDFIMIGIIAAIMLGAQYFFSDKLVMLSMRAKEVDARQAPELHAMIERLAALADLPKPKIAMVQSDMPNAFATGRNPQNAVVAVTTGIMQRLTEPELEAVLGHELSHIKNRDVMVITLASFFATVAQFMMNSLMWMGIFGGHRDRDDRGGGSAIFLVYLASIVVYFISFLLISALSRYRELAADRGGAGLVGSPSRLASALVKISGVMSVIPQQDLRQVESMNAFFIVPALSGESLAGLFSTHPSLQERLARLKRMEQEMERL